MLTSKTQRVNTQNAENLSGTKAAAKFRSKADLGLDALEPRILLDAAAVASGAEMAMDVLSQTDSQAAVDAIFNPQIDMQKEPAEQDISPEMLAQLDRIEEAFEPVLESNAALSPVKESGGFKPANVAEYGGFKPASITEAADETQQGETTAGSVDAVTDDGNYEIHSGETINVDLFANDFIKGELVGIIDPADPNTIITLTENETVELSSGLRAAFLEDGTFDVTGPSNPTERTVSFDYVIQDGSGETHRATATFDWPVTPTIDLDVNNIPPIPGQNGFAVLDFSNLDESSGSTDIGNDGQTEEADGVGNGEFAIYRNVGTIDGQRIDVIATVVRFIGDPNEYPGATPQDGDNPDIGNNGNDGMVILGNADTGSNNDGTFEIRYDVVLSGTDIPVTGNFAIAISDLDATDGTEFGEEVAVNTANLDSFIIGEGGTSDTSASGFGSDIIVENIATQEIFRANQDPAEFITEGFIRFTPFDRNANNAFGSPQANSVQLNFTNTSTFTLIFHRDDQPGGFNLNGGFTSAFFDNPVLVDTNDEFANVFVEGDDPIAIAANTIEIFDEFSISGASIEITNAQLDDVIAVTGTLPAGITATVNSPTSITLMGAATPDAYEQAILAITFENTSSEPNDTVIREIDITVSDDEALTSNTATSFIQVIDIPNDPPVAVDDGPISATGNVIENIDVISNDTDPDPDDSLAVTGIIDPADPGVIISISAGQTVTLASGTTVTLLVNGTLDVLTTPLGLGDETFEYVVSDGLKTDTGEVTLDRSQGSLVSVPASVSGLEDTAIDLGITIDPAIIAGGALPDIIGTDAGFRDGADGATPINFTIPANTTSIRITAYGGLDNGNRSGSEEELQTVTLTVDLAAGTFSGHIFHSRGQSQASVDNYTFNNIALGSASDSNLATPASFSAITLDVVDGVLSLIDSELLLDQAYLVEFLSADGTSVDLLGSSGSVQTPGVTVSTLDIPVEANLVILAVQSGRDGDSRQEDNSNGRIVIDLDTGLASGTLSAQVGRGVDFNTAFAFTDYDITSGESIFTNATIVGDIEGQGNVLVDYTLSLNGDGDLVFERPVDVAQTFSTLISAQSFDRLNEGSAAVDLGSSSTRVNYVANSNVLTTFALDIPEGAQTANLTLATANTSVGNIGDNENRGTATIFVDLVNGTTSGTFIGTRSDSPDLVQWTEVPFGTPPFDSTGPTDGVTSNHSAINHFTDQLAAVLTFDLITAADGSQTLQGSAQPTASQQLGDFANYTIVTQAQYSGRTPVTISGYTTGGTFSSGAFNPETGNWEVDAAELVGLSFIPAEHFSGETEAIVIDYNGNGQTILVDIVRVADAPSLTTVNQIGNENTVIAISDAVASSLVDQDSSETLLIELSGIPEGHSVSDGTNSFTASAGSQSVDVTGWGLTALTYEAPIDVSGDFIIDVRAQSTDTDGFTPTEDTAETTDAFTVTILADTDGDGVADTDDVDDDNDGILDVVEQPIDRQQIITSAGTNTTEVLGTFTSNGTAITTTTNATQGASIGASSSFIADSFSFNEQGFTGTVTTEFSSPVSDIVIDFASVINTSVIGNFTVELANGVILSNLDFTVDPTLPSSFGNTRDLLTASTNGDDIITAIDADGGGGGDQAGGTLRFADLDLDQVLAAGGIVSYAFDIVEASGSAATAFFNISASALADSDADGIVNHLDIDSDNDGITDNIEAQSTAGYIAPSGVEAGITDINNDGLDDAYDSRTVDATTAAATEAAGEGIDPVNTDAAATTGSDTTPDYRDTDSDGDGRNDTLEADLGTTPAAGLSDATTDADGDGLFDVFETQLTGVINDGFNVNEDIASLDGTFPDAGGDTSVGTATPLVNDLDFRDLNDAPTAVNDGPIAVTGGAPQDISVFAGTGQDSDPDGDVISITAIFDPAAPTTPILLSIGDSQTLNSGTIVQLLAGNVFRVTTQVVLTGADSFDYVISDASGETDRASVTLSSVSGNTNPNAQNDAVDAAENTVLNFSAFANNGSGIDSDGEGDNFAVTRVISGGSAAGLTSLADGTGVSSTVMPVIAPSVIAGSNGGAFTVTDLGQINFDPNDDFDDLAVGETRTTQIAYQIDDGNGGTDTAVVTVTVQGENDAPSAVGTLAAQMGFDGTAQASFNASTIFSDVDGDTLSFSSPNLPSWMNLDSGTGIITGQPPANASQGGVNGDGVYTVTVVASDGDMSVSSSVTYTFANLVPTAEDDALSSFENTSSNFDAFAENPNLNLADSDPDGDSFTVTRAATGNDVSALAALADGTGVSTANVGAAIAGSMGGLFALQSGGEATFDPNGEFDDLAVGETRVTEIVYQIDDGEGGTDTAVISYTVIGENDAPIPQIPGSPTPPVDAQNYIPAQTGVDNAAPAPFDLTPYFDDPDSSDVLTLSLDPNDLPPGLVFDGAVISGTLDDDASQGGASGVYVIPVTVSDGNGGSFTTTVTYTIANPAPIAVDDVNLASEDSGVSANVITGGVLSAGADSDPDGDELSVTMVGGAAANIGQAAAGSNGGLFTIGANGSYTFSSNGEFESLGFGETALTSITYQISDGNGGFDTATLEVTVEGQNDGPIPVIPGTNTPPADDQNYIPAVAGVDSVPLIPLDISVYFDDVDGDPLSYSSLDLPSWMRLDPDTGIITGTPPANGSQDGPSANGIYTVTISAEDAQGESFTTQMDYVIGNPSPIAVDDSYITPEDTPISGNLMANDSDPDGDSLRLDVVSLADGSVLPLGGSAALAEGQLTVNADGIFDFVPAPDFNGTLSFGYVVSDGQGGTDVGAVVIIVTPVDEPPMVIIPEPPEPETPEPEMPEPETPEPETPYNGMPPTGSLPPRLNFDGEDISPVDVSTGFSDPEGEALSFSAQGLPPGLTLDPTTGIITGTLPGGASGSGPYTVIITAIDPDGLSVSAEFVWTVENVVPIASPLPPVRALDSTSVSIPAAEAFVDPDGDALRYSAQGVPEGLSIDPQTGMITGMLGHSASQQGPYFITVIATDAQGATTQTIIELIVNNPPPVIEPIELPSMVPGEEIVINVGEMTTDPDGDVSITFTSPDLPLGLTIDIKTGIISGIALAATAAQEFTVFANDSEGGITPVTLIFNVSEDPYIDDVEIFEYSIHGKDDGSALLDGYGASSRESHLARWFDGRRDDDARALGGENVASFLGGTAAGVDLPEYGAQARIWVEGVASSHLVTLQLMETISSASSSDASDSHVRAWNVSLVSGAALPEGVFYEAGADVVTLNRTAVQGAIALRVQAMLSDGRAVSLVIDVDVQNVLIERRGEAAVQAQTLDQQLKIAADDIGGANAALTKALKTNM